MARSRGIQLPDAGDVPKVGLASDPGLRIPDMSGGIEGAGQTLAAGLSRISQAEFQAAERQQRQEDAIATWDALGAYEDATMQELQRRQNEQDTASPDFYKGYTDFLDTKANEIMSSLPEGMSEIAKAELQYRIKDQGRANRSRAGEIHLQGMQDKSLTLIEQRTNIWSAQANRSPADLDDILAAADQQLADFAGTLPLESETKERAKVRGAIIESAVFGLLDKGNIRGARAILGDSEFDGDIEPSRRNVMGNAIDSEQKRLEAEAKAAAAEARAVEIAGVAALYDDEVAAAQQGKYLGLVTEESLATLNTPKDPTRGARAWEALNSTRQLSVDMTSMALLGPPERAAMVESRKPPEGEGFDAAQKEYEAMQKANAEVTKRWAEDPASMAFESSDDLQLAYQKSADTGKPEDLQNAINLSLTLQRQAGVDEEDLRPLSKSQANDIVTKLKAAKPEDMADSIEGQASAYGDELWRRVNRQLVDAGLPSSFQTIITTPNAVARKNLAEVLSMPLKDLQPAGAGDVGGPDEQSDGAMEPLFQTLRAQPGGMSKVTDYREAARRLTYKYGDAERAAREITEQWDIEQEDQINARAPKGTGDTAATTANIMLDNLVLTELRDPGGSSPETANLTPMQRKELYWEGVRMKGKWITNEDDDGWVLTDELGEPVMREDGSRVEFMFDTMSLEPGEPLSGLRQGSTRAPSGLVQ